MQRKKGSSLKRAGDVRVHHKLHDMLFALLLVVLAGCDAATSTIAVSTPSSSPLLLPTATATQVPTPTPPAPLTCDQALPGLPGVTRSGDLLVQVSFSDLFSQSS